MSIIKRENLVEMVERRNIVMEKYADCADKLTACNEALRDVVKILPPSNFIVRTSERDKQAITSPFWSQDKDNYLSNVRHIVDAQFWSHLMMVTGLENVMDRVEKEKFTTAMEATSPVFNIDNAMATVERLVSDSQMMVARGIAEVFSKLDRQFKSNIPFKFGNRIIINNALDDWGFNSYVRADHMVKDVERVFAQLEGRKEMLGQSGYTPTYHAMCEAAREARRPGGNRQWEVETEFFKIRGFKKGTLHLWFMRKDLLQEVNKILGAYYGAALDTSEDVYHADPLAVSRFPLTRARNFGFYPTPETPANIIRREVNATSWDRETRQYHPSRILEPSAGTGNLVYDLAKEGAVVDCVEVQAHLAKGLRDAGIYNRVNETNFLNMQPQSIYDHVLMNPPFDKERDTKHVYHAFKFLKPGGVLVAIMGAGVEFRQTPATVAFRQWVKQLKGHFYDLPEGCFRPVGTNINTVYVKIKKHLNHDK